MHKPWLITVLQKNHQQPHHKPNHAVNSWARRQPAQPLPWAWVFRPLSAHKRAYGLANAGPDCCGYYAGRALCCLRHYPGQIKAQSGALNEPPGAEPMAQAAVEENATTENISADEAGKTSGPMTFWIIFLTGLVLLLIFYAFFTFARLEIFKMLLASFFPLAILILAVLGSIVFGFATPSEAAAMGAFGGLLLAFAYRQLNISMLKESIYLTAKTSAMVCWLFVGSSIFSAAFALLGGQEIINAWVLSMDLTPVEFMIMAQIVIFLLGWPLEWTEIIVIFMPIFLPLLAHYNIDPLFFGILVALNLQTAFLSPPVAMSAFYLKGVAPPHVTLNQIFLGMLPFMGIQIFALILLYVFPQIGLWLPEVLYK